MGILSLIYEFVAEGDIMGTVLGKECYVLHVAKNCEEVHVDWIDAGKIRYGEYKLYIYKDEQLYFKDSIENISVKRSGKIVIINTRDGKNRFEIVLKNSYENSQIIDLGVINSLINRTVS